jgi:GR25 family glycosyltransferase involved in LPS biosynthesis
MKVIDSDIFEHIKLSFNLYNFGADKVYVISEKNSYRRDEFIKAWAWSDLEFEFVDAIMGRDIDIKKMINDGVLTEFIDPNGILSKNIIGVALSHIEAYKISLGNHSDTGSKSFLFMEDDARPTQSLIDIIQNGKYVKFIESIYNEDFDVLWLGRGGNKTDTNGRYYNKYFKYTERYNNPGAQSYILKSKSIKNILNFTNKIDMAADCFLDRKDILNKSIITHKQLVSQMGYILDKFYGDDTLPNTHIYNRYKSQTQLPPHIFPDSKFNHINVDGKFNHVNDDIMDYIKDINDFTYKTDIIWKKIIFNNEKRLI